MSNLETNEAANIIIAELNAKIQSLESTIVAYERELNGTRDSFNKIKIQLSYLESMYDQLLDKVI